MARSRYKATGRAFWDELLEIGAAGDGELRSTVLHQALYHRGEHEGQVDSELDLDPFLADLATGKFVMMPDREMVALTSQVVTTEGKMLHLPMLDFRLPSAIDTLPVALDVLTALGAPGLLVDSGRSYHYYGNQLMTFSELARFLGRAQLLSPLVDQRWVGHQLVSGKCALRVSTDPERSPEPPRPVAFGG